MKKFEQLGRSLSKAEQKLIFGGLMQEGTCQYENPGSYESPVTGLSKETASNASKELGGKWCCDSCCTATWSSKAGCPGYES